MRLRKKGEIRAGDSVHHKPSGETWVVAVVGRDGTYFYPAGWPAGSAELSDVERVREATDEQHMRQLRDSAKLGTHDPRGRGARWRLGVPETIHPDHIIALAECVAAARHVIDRSLTEIVDDDWVDFAEETNQAASMVLIFRGLNVGTTQAHALALVKELRAENAAYRELHGVT